jgi:hypothetical protein
MENRESNCSTGRAELMAALDNLCTAIDRLISAAEVKLSPRIAYELEAYQLNLEFVPSCVPADNLDPGFDQFEFALSRLPGSETTDATASNNSVKAFEEVGPPEEPMFANRLVQLQNRLGGFLK